LADLSEAGAFGDQARSRASAKVKS
jgi:hypothetical protein